ncbi:MAG: hypothetical protein ACRD2Q_10810 [Terriglobales bacterium]
MPSTTPFRELNKDWPPERHARVAAIVKRLKAQMEAEKPKPARKRKTKNKPKP